MDLIVNNPEESILHVKKRVYKWAKEEKKNSWVRGEKKRQWKRRKILGLLHWKKYN